MLLYEGEVRPTTKTRRRVYATLQLAPDSAYHPEHPTKGSLKGSAAFNNPVCFSQIARRELDGRKLVSGYRKFAIYNIARRDYAYKATPKGLSRYDFLDEYPDPELDNTAIDAKYAKMTRIDWCAQRILGWLRYANRDIIFLSMMSNEESVRLKDYALRTLMAGESAEEYPWLSKGADDLKWQADNMEEILEWLYEKELII
jgi:hypothetical protein